MPSPFPGMNPYFEQAAHWQDFHTEFLTVLRRQLTPRILPNYIVQLEEQVFIHDLAPEPRRPLGRPDLSVTRVSTTPVGPPGLGLLDAPAEVDLPAQEVEHIPFLEVRDRQGRELVTVIYAGSPEPLSAEDWAWAQPLVAVSG